MRIRFFVPIPTLLLQVGIHPTGDLVESFYAVLGFASSGELMVFAMEEAEASGHIEIFQRIEHLNTFAHPAAVILVTVNEEGRCLRFICVFQGRLLPKLVMLRPRISADL